MIARGRWSRMEPRGEGEVVAEPAEGAGELDEAEIVLGLLVPADEDTAPPGEPAMRAFDDPASGWEWRVGRWRPIRGPAWCDVGCVVVVDGRLPAGWGVVAGVKGEVLRPVGLRVRTLQHHRLDGRLQELVIGDIGTSNHDREWATVALDQEGALHATFGTVGRV